MKFRDDFENMTEEEIERQGLILDVIFNAMDREKTMVYAPGIEERVDRVESLIESLLRNEEAAYTIKHERCEIFGTTLYIVLETPYFGGAANKKWLFESLLKEVDAIEMSGLPSGNIRFDFALHRAYKELK